MENSDPYVKTDRIHRSISIELGVGYSEVLLWCFAIENKKVNQNYSLIFELEEKNKTKVFNVYYSEKNRETKTEDIIKDLKTNNIKVDEETLEWSLEYSKNKANKFF